MNPPRRILANLRQRHQPTETRSPADRVEALMQATAPPFPDPADEARAIEERIDRWCSALRPGDDWEWWLLRMLATESVRLERLLVEERLLGDLLRRRVGTMWDADRTLAALDLAARLPKDPERVAARLRGTVQGCDWLIRRWVHLRSWLELKGPWDEPRRAMALDALGRAAELREAELRELEGASREEQVALADEQIAALEALRSGTLEARDADERASAEGGTFREVPKALAQVRRARSECARRIAWFQSQFRGERPGPSPLGDAPGPAEPAAGPLPDAEPAPAPAPPPPPPPPPPPQPQPPGGGYTPEEVRRRERLLAILAGRPPAGADPLGSGDAPAASVLPVTAARPQSADLAPSPRRDRRRAPRRRRR